jgi:hypothetical protein
MQILWMVMVSLGLALSGILGLALLAHLDARTRHPVNPAATRAPLR